MIFLEWKWILLFLVVNIRTIKSPEPLKKIRRVILDVDVGLDDALALYIFLYADQMKQVKIEAITCANGNTFVDNVCKNVVRILEIYQKTDIPVYRGASKELILKKSYNPDHTKDSFGDIKHGNEPDISVIKNIPASIAMYNFVKANPHEISIVALAPLTNIALAAKIYDDFLPKVKDLYVMGGNYGGIGSKTPMAETNFYTDPESAQIILDSYKHSLNLLIYQTCWKTTLTLNWRYDVLDKTINPAFRLLNEAEKKYVHHPTKNGSCVMLY